MQDDDELPEIEILAILLIFRRVYFSIKSLLVRLIFPTNGTLQEYLNSPMAHLYTTQDMISGRPQIRKTYHLMWSSGYGGISGF